MEKNKAKDVIKWLTPIFVNYPECAKKAKETRAQLRNDYPWIFDEDLKKVQFSLGAYFYQQKSKDAMDILLKEAELLDPVSEGVLNLLYRQCYEPLPEGRLIRQYFPSCLL